MVASVEGGPKTLFQRPASQRALKLAWKHRGQFGAASTISRYCLCPLPSGAEAQWSNPGRVMRRLIREPSMPRLNRLRTANFPLHRQILDALGMHTIAGFTQIDLGFFTFGFGTRIAFYVSSDQQRADHIRRARIDANRGQPGTDCERAVGVSQGPYVDRQLKRGKLPMKQYAQAVARAATAR